MEQWSIDWPTCLSSWASVPLIERGRLPLCASQSIVCFPPRTEKVVFCEGAIPTIMWWPFYPTANSLHQLNGLCGRHSLYVCVLMEGGGRKRPIESRRRGGGGTHTAYHKGASGRRNVYMMSNDSPKIGLSFRKKKKRKKWDDKGQP